MKWTMRPYSTVLNESPTHGGCCTLLPFRPHNHLGRQEPGAGLEWIRVGETVDRYHHRHVQHACAGAASPASLQWAPAVANHRWRTTIPRCPSVARASNVPYPGVRATARGPQGPRTKGTGCMIRAALSVRARPCSPPTCPPERQVSYAGGYPQPSQRPADANQTWLRRGPVAPHPMCIVCGFESGTV